METVMYSVHKCVAMYLTSVLFTHLLQRHWEWQEQRLGTGMHGVHRHDAFGEPGRQDRLRRGDTEGDC